MTCSCIGEVDCLNFHTCTLNSVSLVQRYVNSTSKAHQQLGNIKLLKSETARPVLIMAVTFEQSGLLYQKLIIVFLI